MAIGALAASACVVTTLTGSASGDNVTQLKNKLGSAQSQLNGAKQREQTLSGSVAALNSRVSSLGTEISLVQSREAAARERLVTYEQRLAATRDALVRERRHLAHLRKVLDRAQSALKDELVSQYEQPQQSVVSLLVDSSGVQQLVNGLQYLSRAKQQEQSIITATRTARAAARAGAARLTALQHGDAQAAGEASTQTNGLAGMNALLNSEQDALAHEREAQTAALAVSRERGAQLQSTISTIQKQEAAAEAAARTVTYDAGGGLGPSGGWAIPYPIVLCESGGQNLPPNSAGASGYYQIVPATWKDFGGSGPAAYLAPKSEQDAVATRIWNNGAGASNWTCAGIVGIS
jgi:septal ring factor EnvC (AmiA/AmiB activator)